MISINLQLFAGEKTEKATPKKQDDSRKKGQVARSQEFGQAVVLLAGLFTIKILSGYYMDQFTQMFQFQLTGGLYYKITDESITPLFIKFLILLAKLILPVAGVIMVVGAFSSFLQVGALFTMTPLMPDFKKINPIEGFKRIFSMRTFVDLLKSIVKMLAIGFIVYSELIGDWKRVSQLGGMDVIDMLSVVSSFAFGIFWKVGFAMLAIALADLMYQRFDFAKNLRMSKQEIKEEYKQMEGSPEVKGKIKERQRAIAMSRMMSDVPKADVIITNPTHFAVALKYDPNNMESPQVIAKGLDETAQRIKKVARESNVICVENRPLAQALYKTVEIGDAVPGDLFQAVAEVLAYVYRLKGKV